MLRNFFTFLVYLKPLKWIFALALGFGAIAAIASGIGIPTIASKIFPIVSGHTPPPLWADNWIQSHFPEAWYSDALLALACLFIPAVFIVRGAATFINSYLTNMVGMKVLEEIRMDVFARLQIIPLSFHERQQKGDLISRLVSDAQHIQAGITQVANDVIKQPFTLLSALTYLIINSIRNADFFNLLANLFFISLAIFPIYFLSKRIMKKAKRSQERIGDMNATASENLSSQREVRAYGMQPQQISLFHAISEQFRQAQMKTVKYRQSLNPLLEIISAFAMAFLLLNCYKDNISTEDFMGICAALFMCYDPVKRLGVTYNRLKQAEASLDRLKYILDEPDTMEDPANPPDIGRFRGNVRFGDVCFSYDGENQVLNHITLDIPQGQVVALVGPSGAGKTTFASLIPRFYDVTHGGVSIDGHDLREMTKHQLRKNIALVSQSVALFRNTIMENIRAGRPDATDEEVIEASRKASVHEFVQQMPDGYATLLGDGGAGLSGGQRQRVAIARAFLKDAPILILDEATASLDAESEIRIQDELDLLVKGRTTLIVAHRFSSIRIADRILVFEEGSIIGDGSHEYLYGNCPLYRELYDKQSF